ncbi:Radical S-adenosyl methionine domain-containing protein, variant 3 [Balamuthia mandrillaris]
MMKRKLASRMFACRSNAPSHPRRRHSIRSVSCSPSSLSIYVHWPFCSRICPYCDFNRYLAADVDEERMLRCFRSELDHFYFHFGDSAVKDRKVTSVFFGGGTPSLASPKIFGGIMEHINKRWNVAADVEVTMEANPTSAEAKKLKDFKQSGVNRVSIGVQSLREDDLAFLGRAHSVQEAKRVIEGALGLFDRVSFDLIYARHGKQTPELWRQELQEAVKLGTSHLSLYTLTLEPGTEFYRRALHPSISDSRKPSLVTFLVIVISFWVMLLTNKTKRGGMGRKRLCSGSIRSDAASDICGRFQAIRSIQLCDGWSAMSVRCFCFCLSTLSNDIKPTQQ